MRALELRIGLGARARLQHLVQRLVRDQRIDQRAIHALRHAPERGERDGVLGLVPFDPGDAGLGDADAPAQLGGGHAEGLTDGLDPATRRARELGRLAQRRETAL